MKTSDDKDAHQISEERIDFLKNKQQWDDG